MSVESAVQKRISRIERFIKNSFFSQEGVIIHVSSFYGSEITSTIVTGKGFWQTLSDTIFAIFVPSTFLSMEFYNTVNDKKLKVYLESTYVGSFIKLVSSKSKEEITCVKLPQSTLVSF